MFRSKLCGFIAIFTILRRIDWVVVNVRRERRSHGGLLETGGIGRRLTSELSKVEVGASFVTQIH